VLWILPTAVACGGGGGGGGDPVVPGGDSSMTATFVAESPAPPPLSTAMALSGVSGDLVTVAIQVTDTNGIYGAAFSVAYDPARAAFVGWSPGVLLEQGGHAPTYQVDAGAPGTLVAGVTRNGNVPGVSAAGSRSLIRLTFRVLEAGATPLGFSGTALFDAGIPPQPIPGVLWYAGALQAS
jgi:hypothetical protein